MYFYSKNHKKIGVVIKKGFRIIMNKASGAFWLAYPKNSSRAGETIFWESASDLAAVLPGRMSSAKVNPYVLANLCANLFGLVARPVKSKKGQDHLEFVFKK